MRVISLIRRRTRGSEEISAVPQGSRSPTASYSRDLPRSPALLHPPTLLVVSSTYRHTHTHTHSLSLSFSLVVVICDTHNRDIRVQRGIVQGRVPFLGLRFHVRSFRQQLLHNVRTAACSESISNLLTCCNRLRMSLSFPANQNTTLCCKMERRVAFER
jgi:hypothetical protein